MAAVRSGGDLLIACLEAQGVDRVFCVPGESYLPALDALFESEIHLVAARHEGAAAMMAEADAKLTGRPGVCFVTRGPGATNASAGVHVARQDSTPMLLFVGLIGRAMVGREAFQEFDLALMFTGLAKAVHVAESAERLPEIVNRAMASALNGRPGPVVIGLPEDMLREETGAAPGPRVARVDSAPTPAQAAEAAARLAAAERPILILGGSGWTEAAAADAARLAARFDLPTAVTFRRQQLIDHESPIYAGELGLGANPALTALVENADLVALVGARFSENPSRNFELFEIPKPRQALIHVHPGPEEVGRIYAPDLGVVASPGAFLAAVLAASGDDERLARRGPAAHAAYLDWSAPRANDRADGVDLAGVMAAFDRAAPADAICTNGAGNYAAWLHRHHRYRGFGTQLAPISGSMGYGLPAAIAAKLRRPEREVFAFAGDGCFQMTSAELATARQTGAGVVVLVADNGMWGTIRMHQERRYPGRVVATGLENPDFAALAQACGCFGARVETTDAFAPALQRARAAAAESHAPAVLHLLTDPQAISPNMRLS